MCTGPKIDAPHPMYTSSPITGGTSYRTERLPAVVELLDHPDAGPFEDGGVATDPRVRMDHHATATVGNAESRTDLCGPRELHAHQELDPDELRHPNEGRQQETEGAEPPI